jgi:hypothetical protein
MHSERTPCECKGRDQSDKFASQRMSKVARKPPKAKTEAGSRFSLTALRRNWL